MGGYIVATVKAPSELMISSPPILDVIHGTILAASESSQGISDLNPTSFLCVLLVLAAGL